MKKPPKYRVIIDTNFFISAVIVAPSLPDQLLKAWQEDKYNLIISQDLLEEIKQVSEREYLKKKYHLLTEKIIHLLVALKLAAEIVTPLPDEKLPVHCRDHKDDMLLALAFAGNADYLITGDKDLLDLNDNHALQKLKIVTVRKLLVLLGMN